VADRRPAETAELRRLRRRIDALDRRIVRLLNERADLARAVGREKAATGRRAIRDAEREREVLLRVSMANDGPTPQADLLAIFRRLFVVARALERRDRHREKRIAAFDGAVTGPVSARDSRDGSDGEG
jgi:chorismate mutase